MERTYAEYAAHQAVELLAIDSPTGFTRQAAEWDLARGVRAAVERVAEGVSARDRPGRQRRE